MDSFPSLSTSFQVHQDGILWVYYTAIYIYKYFNLNLRTKVNDDDYKIVRDIAAELL